MGMSFHFSSIEQNDGVYVRVSNVNKRFHECQIMACRQVHEPAKRILRGLSTCAAVNNDSNHKRRDDPSLSLRSR